MAATSGNSTATFTVTSPGAVVLPSGTIYAFGVGVNIEALPRVVDAIAALRYLADPDSWGGDPHEQGATLYGHDTPFELARRALGEMAAADA